MNTKTDTPLKASKVAENIAQEHLDTIVDQALYPINDTAFREHCRREFDEQGVLVLPGFLMPDAIARVVAEGEQCQHLAYYTASDHNIYLKPDNPEFGGNHPRNRRVTSSKGCITTDQVPENSPLVALYNSSAFKDFLCAVLDETSLHEYNDPLSSINLHYAAKNQELGWHFDNSSFAITLLVQKPESGAVFEYVKNVRDADCGDMNYEQAGAILDGDVPVQSLSMDAGALVLFRGRNALHRVTPTEGEITRMLAVLAYNTKAGIALSESARMTFYGRLR